MGPDGWSEIHYRDGSTPKASQDTAQALVNERVKLLVSVGQIHHVRISGTTPGSRSYRFIPTGGQGGRVASKVRDVGAVTQTIGLYSAAGFFRKLAMHGFPDISSEFDAAGTQDVSIKSGVATFLTYLKTNGYQIRHITTPAADPALLPVSNIAVANGIVTFTTAAPGLAVGQKVRISSCKGLRVSQFNGVWTVAGLVAGPPAGFTATTKRGIDPDFIYTLSTGKVRDASPASYSYPTIDSWDTYMQASTRKTGRPTDEHRGRRSLTR
jgi:hypothetical protein